MSHRRIREALDDVGHFSFRPTDEGDCGISLLMKFDTDKEASAFSRALVAEGIPCGPTSACTNLLERYPIKSKKMVQEDVPPFGKGYIGENAVYDSSLCPNTNRILARHVSIPIAPLYSDEDIEDIIKAVKKVDRVLYP